MYKPNLNKRKSLRFTQFSRKSYALFSVLGREVLIGTLSVACLSHAKADGVSTHVELVSDTAVARQYGLDEVEVTGTRAPLTQSEAARVVGTITRTEINRAGVSTLNDLLKRVIGVDVRQRGGFGVQTDVTINGGTFDQITILLNGVDISNPQTGHNTAFFPVALQDIERIEVLEGASSRVFGTQAFNGAINIVTRNRSNDKMVSANVEGGSFGSFGAVGSLKLGGRTGFATSNSLLVSGGYHRSDGGIAHTDFERWHGYAHYNADFTPGVSLAAQVGANHQNYGAATFYSAKYNNQYENASNMMASVSVSLHDAMRRWEVQPVIFGNQFIDHYQLIRGKSGASVGENFHNLGVLGAGVNANFAWIAGKTALGVEVRHERLYSTAYGRLLEDADYKDIPGSQRMFDHKASRTNHNIYLEHNVMAGGFTFSVGALANHNSALGEGLHFYPGIDVSYRPDEHWKVFISWNKALRLPTYTDLYTMNAVQQGDVNLQPERKHEWRTGAKWSTRGLDVTLSGFISKGKNMIDWVFTSAQSTKYHALNIGKLDNMGYSLEAAVRPEMLWQGCPVEKVSLGYAYIHQKHETEAEIYKSLYALEYLKHKFTFVVDHRIWRKLAAEWSLRYQQRMNGYHPYWKLDGKLQWTEKAWDVYVQADNLTAHRYYDYATVQQPGLWLMAGVNLHLGL